MRKTKTITVEVNVCDQCGLESDRQFDQRKCTGCGKDICQGCTHYFTIEVQRVLLENTPRPKRGRPSADDKKQSSATALVPYRSGARKVTLALRLSQEKPKFYDRLARGDFKTITH